jgi:hypothetical protein
MPPQHPAPASGEADSLASILNAIPKEEPTLDLSALSGNSGTPAHPAPPAAAAPPPAASAENAPPRPQPQKVELSPTLAEIMGVSSLDDLAGLTEEAEKPPLEPFSPPQPESPSVISDDEKIARHNYDGDPPPDSEFLRMFPGARA